MVTSKMTEESKVHMNAGGKSLEYIFLYSIYVLSIG